MAKLGFLGMGKMKENIEACYEARLKRGKEIANV
jgi:hypothetical protein